MPTGVYDRSKIKHIDSTVRAQIVADRNTGQYSLAKLAEKHHIGKSTVSRILKEANETGGNAPLALESQPTAKQRGKYAHHVPEMLALRAQGMTYVAIDKKLGLNRGNTLFYLKKRKAGISANLENKGAPSNGHEQLDTKFLVGFGCAELERTVAAIAQRLGIPASLLRQGFSKFLGSSQVR